MSKRQLTTIYCDDIRQEVGNKQSFMGIYNGEMVLETLPITIAKFCISVRIATPSDTPFKNVKVTVYLDEAVINELMFDEASFQNTFPPQDGISDDDDDGSTNFQVISVAMVFAPLMIMQKSRIRVHADIDGELVKGASLKIGVFERPLDSKAPENVM